MTSQTFSSLQPEVVEETYRQAVQTVEDAKKTNDDHKSAPSLTTQMIQRYHPKRLQFRVSEVIKETSSSSTIRLAPRGCYLPPFQAGQYINVFVTIDGVKTSRPYAISSSPSERGYYDITVKRVADGFVSAWLIDQIGPDDRLETSGPTGAFFYSPVFHGDEVIFLAGGSGVTPALAMIRDIVSRGLDRKFHLIYGSQSPGDILFREVLDDLAARHDNIQVDHVISEPDTDYEGHTGFLTGSLISDLAGDIGTRTVYVCGPQIMQSFCIEELKKLGVKQRRIRTEANGPPMQPEKRGGWPEDVAPTDTFEVTVSGATDRSFKVLAGEPLLNSLERNGVSVEAACRSGECSLCRVRLVKGSIFAPGEAHVRKSDKRFGFIHSCVSYPVDDIEIQV